MRWFGLSLRRLAGPKAQEGSMGGQSVLGLPGHMDTWRMVLPWRR